MSAAGLEPERKRVDLQAEIAALRGQVEALEKGREIMMVVQAEQERWREETQAALDAAQSELAKARAETNRVRELSLRQQQIIAEHHQTARGLSETVKKVQQQWDESGRHVEALREAAQRALVHIAEGWYFKPEIVADLQAALAAVPAPEVKSEPTCSTCRCHPADGQCDDCGVPLCPRCRVLTHDAEGTAAYLCDYCYQERLDKVQEALP